jgi:hypothetical protein
MVCLVMYLERTGSGRSPIHSAPSYCAWRHVVNILTSCLWRVVHVQVCSEVRRPVLVQQHTMHLGAAPLLDCSTRNRTTPVALLQCVVVNKADWNCERLSCLVAVDVCCRQNSVRAVRGFRGDVDEMCAVMGWWAACSGKCLLTFRDSLSAPSSGVKKSRTFDFGFLGH